MDMDLPATGDATRNSVVTLTLPGLNVQWPFSQLLLAALKKCEIRRYALGHRNIAHVGAELWIVETCGVSASASKNAVLGDVALGARPAKAQIVGTITFSQSAPYAGLPEFRADAAAHRIKAGGAFDWDGNGEMHAWRVASVRPLAHPVPVGSTGQAGFGPRSFDVTFLGVGPALRAVAPPLAIATPAGGAASIGGDASQSCDVDGIGARSAACPARSPSRSRCRSRRRSRSGRADRAAVTPDARRSPPCPTTPVEALGHGKQTSGGHPFLSNGAVAPHQWSHLPQTPPELLG